MKIDFLFMETKKLTIKSIKAQKNTIKGKNNFFVGKISLLLH